MPESQVTHSSEAKCVCVCVCAETEAVFCHHSSKINRDAPKTDEGPDGEGLHSRPWF